jgi:NDP-sugar pyrophosphorylase family protein
MSGIGSQSLQCTGAAGYRLGRAGGATRATTADATPRTKVGGVVLAGVHQWGGCVLDKVLPRPLLPIANRPLVTYSMDWLRAAGVRDLSLCANCHTRLIRKHLCRRSWDEANIDYYEDTMPRGPAGCVKDAWFDERIEVMVVLDGTTVPRCDLGDLMAAHEESEAVLTVVVAAGALPGRAQREALVPTGIYLFSKRALECVRSVGYQDIKEKLIPDLYGKDERVVTYRSELPVPRVTGEASYLAVNDWTLEMLLDRGAPPGDYRRIGDAWVHSSTKVHPSAELIGPVLVGPGGTLGKGVTVIGPTSVGARSRVGEQAVICRSSIWSRCVVGAGSVLDRCVLTHGVELWPETGFRDRVCTEMKARFSLLGRPGV